MNEIKQLDDLETRNAFEFPAREPWSSAAVKLLKGVVYHDDQGNTWDEILSNVSPLTDHFARLGLVLIVDENDGLAWLHQPDTEELPEDYETMPKLFHKVALGFEGTLLCVVLRDELRRSEEEELQNERCVLAQADLLTIWRTFFPDSKDEVRLNDSLSRQLAKFEKLKFVRRFEKAPPSWEVRRILKARLPLETLKSIRAELQEELVRREASVQ